MMEGIFDSVIPFVQMNLGGIPVAVGVLIFVQLLNYVGLATEPNQKRVATVITALIFSGVWVSTQITGAMVYQDWVGLIYQALVGAVVASLGYVKLVEPRINKG